MIEQATPLTANYVADNLADDEIGVIEFGRDNAAELCFECARDSVMSWAVVVDGEPVCLFGADGASGDEWASAWMFSTPNVQKARFEVIRGARKAVEFSRDFWPELRIRAEDRTEKQIKFLKLIGFKPSQDDPTELIL